MTFDPENSCKTHKWPHNKFRLLALENGISGILQCSVANRSSNLGLTSSGYSHDLLDFAQTVHQRSRWTCLRWFLKTFRPYLTPCQTAKTGQQVHDCTAYDSIPCELI